MRLQDCLNELNQAMDGVAEFSRAAQHAVNLWQFKNEPRLEKIQKIISKYQA
ncbi:hypothetical protein [Limosilactobacillus pulli]|nr:hypothetical protein [Limosilactobacillus pulli]